MQPIQSYQDICKEIDIFEIRIKDLEREYQFWYHGCFNSSRRFSAPLDICLKRMETICDQVEAYSRVLEEKEKTRKAIEERLNEFDGLEYKVRFMQDVEGKTLAEIAAELGYSYDWIRKINSRIKKAQRRHTAIAKNVVR
ncbi:sigma-70 family RNA polymerase sigma factor [Brevibacillus fortis]|uniref:RNA polymerase sigma-70 region 4 domain-containing protein n=1 Tax=Brevibacillus fortis TaxID=2126352 RepID=A0A2P7V3S3_9BACL|nr:sigma-70 family RNA polymerase sigma factor [Brevibacillus fortis]PSJ93861.1 hypothetical protein C7R93_16905 [Brevibacillus fortis]